VSVDPRDAASRKDPAARLTSLSRRSLAAMPCLLLPAAAAATQAEWAAYQRRFLAPEGRIIDTGNNGVSHSEGQGWGLMLAAAFEDREAFDRILAWTRRTLKRPQDQLHSWRYRPAATPKVDDPNNATDGDLYIAWALLLAHARWQHEAYLEDALAIANDVLRLTQRRIGERSVLLPGVAGFETATSLTLNPSYVVLPAFAALHRAAPRAGWDRVAQGGLDLLRRARFGAWALSPDWVAQARRPDGRLSLPDRWPPRFSFDAVRVPLLLAWAGETRHPALIGAHRFWTDPRWRAPPAWVDLMTGRTADFAISSGVRAIASFVAARIANDGAPIALPSINEAQDYYSASLTLLVRMACEASGIMIR